MDRTAHRSFSGTVARWWPRALVLAAVLAVAACSSLRAPVAPRVEPPSGAGIAVLVSGEELAFQAVVRELVRQAGPGVQVHSVGDSASGRAALVRRLDSPEISQVIAVGLPAARVARRLSDKRVVFCQVFNYQEAGLVSPTMKGVSAIPPLGEPFRMWKEIDPRLTRIGAITGPQLTGLVREARVAARAAGIELEHVEVRSDKETLYAFQRLLPRIQGLWLVPDNRVLSAAVIRDVLSLAVREGRQVLGFRHELLALGALLSAESDPADVAAQALARARARPAGSAVPGAAVTALTRADVRINRVVLHSLGLQLPAALAGKIHAH
jgi:ABC-type uncharacterized transport system substrate-binding protein